MSFAAVWRNRWWGVDATVKNRIHFTQVFQAQSWPTLFYIDIPFERGDQITALMPLGDTLIVFGNVKVFLIIGQTSLDFEVRPSAGAVNGALGFRAVTIIEQGVFHVSSGGAFLFDGATDRLLTQDLDPAWRDLMSRAAVSDIARIAALYHDPRKEVHISVPTLYGTTGPGEWVLDLTRTRLQQDPSWTSTTRAIGGYISWDGAEATAGNRGRLFSWDMTQGLLNEEITGTTANGNDIVVEYQGAALVGAQYRTSRFIDIHGEYLPATATFSLDVFVDDKLVTTVVLPTGASQSIYGTAIWHLALHRSRAQAVGHDVAVRCGRPRDHGQGDVSHEGAVQVVRLRDLCCRGAAVSRIPVLARSYACDLSGGGRCLHDEERWRCRRCRAHQRRAG
jgi:hypothetical protein